MTDQGEVVIRDDDGTDHVFPAGFDPTKAIAIVRAAAPARTDVKPVSENEPGTYWGGVGRSLKQQFSEAVDPGYGHNEFGMPYAVGPSVREGMNTPLAHPTGTRLDALTSPASLLMATTGALGKTKAANTPINRGSVGRGLQSVGEFDMTHPLKSTVGKVGEWLQQTPDSNGASPNATWTQRPAPPDSPPAPPEPHLDLSRPIQPGGLTQAQMLERFKAVEANGGLPPQATDVPASMPLSIRERGLSGPAAPISGTLRMAPPSTPPIKVDTTSLPESWKPLAEPSPLQQPRVDIGAEKVGRDAGLTKQQVRDQTAPILGEQPGQASPILPEGALKRIIDTLKEMPKGGPEREAYVARATSGKTQWQVENIRRTLEHLGLIVPVAVAGDGMVREALIRRLNDGAATPNQ